MAAHQLKLGVNVDHVATLRQARGTPYPSPLAAARLCARAGADSLTVHLREDRRHIRDEDVYEIKQSRVLPLNLEMANHPDIVRVALDVKPDEACLVPERREELTTEGGLDVAGQQDKLGPTVSALQEAGVVVSLFVEADPKQLEASSAIGVTHVELHTGRYCDASGRAQEEELARLVEGARVAHGLGLTVNAGHGLNLDNIGGVLEIPFLDTLNIGHSIVARAVLVGMEAAVREMREALSGYRGGRA